MRIQNNTDIEIKPHEWLYIVAAIIILMLAVNGNLPAAVEVLKQLLPKPR